jgi:hypothetical protein
MRFITLLSLLHIIYASYQITHGASVRATKLSWAIDLINLALLVSAIAFLLYYL